MLKAKDIMTREVHTVTPETSVEELARLFLATGVNAMPVVDSKGRLFGIITETDLIARDQPLHLPTVISLFDWVIYLESEDRFRQQVEKLTAQKVGEICTHEVTTVSPEATVQEIAALMVEKGVHLIPVVENEQVVGVVARVDIIRSMGV
ncbi:MAG: CBS domain-containing protein [Syntrophotaleaceae bacterium]